MLCWSSNYINARNIRMNIEPKDSNSNLDKELEINTTSGTQLSNDTAAIIAALVHLAGWFFFIIPSLICYIVFQDTFIRAHAKEALNFQINMMLYGVIYILSWLFLIPVLFVDPTGVITITFSFVSTIFIFLLSIVFVVYPIIGAIKAAGRVKYRFPFVVRFVK